MKNSLAVLLFASAILASCASNFSAGASQEITPEEFVSEYRVDPLDQMLYYGSDSSFHYFFRARPIGSRSFKIKRSDFRLVDEFPLAEARKPVFLVGRFDPLTRSWIQKEGSR